MFRALGDRSGIALCLEGWAATASAEREDWRAARLFGVADSLRSALGFPVAPVDQVDHEHAVSDVKARMGQEAFAAAWTTAHKALLNDVLDETLRYATEQRG